MTQMPHMDNPYADAPTETKTSGVAVAALVCSLIFCCPVTTILGILLGVAGFFHAGGVGRKGRGLAVAAIIIGLIATAGQYLGGKAFADAFIRPVMEGPKQVLEAGFAGDIAGARAAMAPTANVTDGEMSAFIAELRDRYGEFQGSAFDESGQPPQPQPGAPSQTFPYVLTFSNGQINAEAEIIFADQQTGAIIMKPGDIVVFDPDLGDLTLPPIGGGAGDSTDEDSGDSSG